MSFFIGFQISSREDSKIEKINFFTNGVTSVSYQPVITQATSWSL